MGISSLISHSLSVVGLFTWFTFAAGRPCVSTVAFHDRPTGALTADHRNEGGRRGCSIQNGGCMVLKSLHDLGDICGPRFHGVLSSGPFLRPHLSCHMHCMNFYNEIMHPGTYMQLYAVLSSRVPPKNTWRHYNSATITPPHDTIQWLRQWLRPSSCKFPKTLPSVRSPKAKKPVTSSRGRGRERSSVQLGPRWGE